MGTGNDLAHLLGTGDDGRLVAALRERHVEFRDVLAVETAADGLRSAMLLGPRLCYSVGFFRALLRHECPTLRVRVGDRTLHEPKVVALAGNSAHAGGGMMRVAPGARMDDGEMNVSLIRATGRLEVARQFLRLVRGTHVSHPLVRYFPATSMEIEGTPPQSVAVDGEVLDHTPVRIEVRPSCLPFLVGSK